jgi:hypothetical protein
MPREADEEVPRCFQASPLEHFSLRALISLFTPEKVERSRFWASLSRFACEPRFRHVVHEPSPAWECNRESGLMNHPK